MAQYSQVPTEEPPVYAEQDAPRSFGDNVPDDFKYSVNVASCELPIRQMFIRKVYSLLTMQLLGTVFVGYVMRSNDHIKEWCVSNIWLFFVTMVGSIGFSIATYVKARSYPTNLIMLGAFTLCESYSIGLVCAFVETEIVVQAVFLTAVIFIGLTIFAFQTKYDFTSWQGGLSMALWGLIGFGFIFFFLPYSETANLIYSLIGAAIFSVYVLVDTQLIMKKVNLDDEIIATMSLYLDILNLFLYILRILQNNRND